MDKVSEVKSIEKDELCNEADYYWVYPEWRCALLENDRKESWSVYKKIFERYTYYIEPICPAVAYPIIEPKEKLLSFPEALRVVLEGGKVRWAYWVECNKYLYLKDNLIYLKVSDQFHHLIDEEFDYTCNEWRDSWEIVEPAPKPKVPKKLAEYKKDLQFLAATYNNLCMFTAANIIDMLNNIIKDYEE